MRLRQIEISHAVYTHGSISAAARALGVSRPAASKELRRGIHLAWLEDRPLARLGQGFAATLRASLIGSHLAEAAE